MTSDLFDLTGNLRPHGATHLGAFDGAQHDLVNLGVDAVRYRDRLVIKLGDLIQHALERFAGTILGHEIRIPGVSVDAVKARDDDGQHQCVSQCVNVPTELKARMKRRHKDQ